MIVSGYVVRVNAVGDSVGMSHAVVGLEASGKPELACRGDSSGLNWTLSAAPKTTLCPQCKLMAARAGASFKTA